MREESIKPVRKKNKTFNLSTGQKFGRWTVVDPTLYLTQKSNAVVALLQCDCGTEPRYVYLHEMNKRLKKKGDVGCLSCSRLTYRVPVKQGEVYGCYSVISHVPRKRKNGILEYQVQCECGYLCWRNVTTLSRNEINCNVCNKSGSRNHLWKGVGEITGNRFSSIRTSARKRGRIIPFEITIEFIWDLFLSQDRKCALSGQTLTFSPDSTASLDRIDSSKGYIQENVQWVHKDVNVAKQDMSDADFIAMCKLVAEHNS